MSPVVAIGGSAGAIPALRELLHCLPSDFPAPVVIAIHLAPTSQHQCELREVLGSRTALTVKWTEHGEGLSPGIIYSSPQDRHTAITDACTIETSPAPHRPRPSVNHLFASVAKNFRSFGVDVLLSGCLSDGAVGAKMIVDAGGTMLAQDRESSQFDMPYSALGNGANALTLSPQTISAALTMLLMTPSADKWFRVGKDSIYVSSVLSEGQHLP